MKKVVILLAVLQLLTSTSWAQSNTVTGVWTLVSVENVNADSSNTFPYGQSPQGLLIFEPSGDYAIQILKAGRPLIASNNKNTATAEENKVLVQGSNSHFGKYSIDAGNHTITYKVAHAFYPNWEGRELKTSYTISGDTLRSYSNNTTNGGSSAIVTWKRMHSPLLSEQGNLCWRNRVVLCGIEIRY